MNFHRYFSYGSNMNLAQMKKRCPDSNFLQLFCLHGFKLVFNRMSKKRNCGVASIIKTNNNEDYVWGSIFLVSSDDMLKLDRFEGLGAGYSRKYMKDFDMWYYCVTKNDDIFIQPSDEYLNLIVTGLNENFCIDSSYISKIIDIKNGY